MPPQSCLAAQPTTPAKDGVAEINCGKVPVGVEFEFAGRGVLGLGVESAPTSIIQGNFTPWCTPALPNPIEREVGESAWQ